VAGIGLLASCIACSRSQDPGRRGLQGWLQALAAEVPAAAALGRQYLRQRPGEASAAWLVRQLFDEEPYGRAEAVRRVVAQRIGQRREADFRDGNLVVLQGWLVTQTEARLLALLSLRTG
jgi:hypothetical protein